MRKIIFKLNWLIAIAFLLVISSTSTAYGQEYTPIPIAINGQELPLEAGAVNYKGINMIPLKLLKDICGYELYWEDSIKVATMLKDNEYIRVSLGNTIATVNGKTTYMKEAPLIIEGRILVPLDFLAENTNLEVYWSPINKKVNIYDPNLKSQFNDEVQGKLKNRMIKAIGAADQQLGNLDVESYIEFIIFENINSIKLDERYLEDSLAYTALHDKNVKNLGRNVILKEKPVGGSSYTPAETQYSLSKAGVNDYKVEVYDGESKVIYEIGEEPLENEDKEKLPLESSDASKLVQSLSSYIDLIKMENTQITGANRVYDSEKAVYTAIIDTYVHNKDLPKTKIDGIYPLNKIVNVRDNKNNHMDISITIQEGSEKLKEINIRAIMNIDLDSEYAKELKINKTNDLWVYVLGNYKFQ